MIASLTQLDRPTSALHTDRYELTMLAAARRSGAAERRAVFEVFTRSLPAGRRYGVVAGTGRLLDRIADFRFDADTLAFLRDEQVVDPGTLDWLADYRFTGTISGYREGELFFPHSPILTVEGTFAEAVVLETLILSVLNFDAAVASAASRMVLAANGRDLFDMGGRRIHDAAAVAAARAAYVAGFDATSNLEAGYRYGVPTRGTSAHAFVLAHATEADAFAAQMDALGPDTTLLVDTYDIPTAIDTGVRLARERGVSGPGAIRIDSGDLRVEAMRARAQLDSLGATATRIAVSGDLDEDAIARLNDAPIDSYGVGTRLACGSGAPTVGFVYKLVAVGDPGANALTPVAKRSRGKVSIGGRKVAHRALDSEGFACGEHVVAHADHPTATPLARSLQTVLLTNGDRFDGDLAAARSHHQAALAELRPEARRLTAGTPAFDGTPR